MSKTTRPAPEGRAFITGRVSPEDLARARPISEVMADVDRLTAEQEGEILATVKRNGTDPAAVYAKWNGTRRAKRE